MAVNDLNHRLIIFEGIPGSGKTTFSKKTAQYLSKSLKVNFFSEGNMHPADLSWLACVPESEFHDIIIKYPEYENDIEKHSVLEHGYKIIEFYNFKIDDKELFKTLENYEIYGGRSGLGMFKDLHMKRWSDYSFKIYSKNEISVFECVFLQNHINELLLFYKKNEGEIAEYLLELAGTAADLHPAVIYLEQNDVRRTIENVSKERVNFKGERIWRERVIDYICSSPFGKEKGLSGLEGMIEYFKIRQEIELSVLGSLPFRSEKISSGGKDWDIVWKDVTNSVCRFTGV